MNLINEIQAKGLCHRCGEDTASAISLTEAKEIMELVKQKCIDSVLKVAACERIGSGTIHLVDAIKAIEGVE